MKIRINEKESYEINTDDELSGQEFLIFKDRINTIAKLMSDPFAAKQAPFQLKTISEGEGELERVQKPFRTRRPGIMSTIFSREQAVEILKLYYNDKELLNEQYKAINRDGLKEKSGDSRLMSKEMLDIRRKFTIQPNEVGFTRLPSLTEIKNKEFEHLKLIKEPEEQIEVGEPKEI